MSVNLTFTFSDCGKKPEHLEETGLLPGPEPGTSRSDHEEICKGDPEGQRRRPELFSRSPFNEPETSRDSGRIGQQTETQT